MATTVTIPGATGLVSNSYALTDNTNVALQIQAALVALQASGHLTSSVSGAIGPTVPAGNFGALDITAGGTYAAPAGFLLAADSTNGGVASAPGANLTLTGFADLFGGDGNINFTNVATPTLAGATGPESITAGNGNDMFALVSGSTYS
ncbi:MAG: hypothetical protein ACREJM_05735, partial [Candidatus Saccharimonadales bacterium]